LKQKSLQADRRQADRRPQAEQKVKNIKYTKTDKSGAGLLTLVPDLSILNLTTHNFELLTLNLN
jgi:hypothetical protein